MNIVLQCLTHCKEPLSFIILKRQQNQYKSSTNLMGTGPCNESKAAENMLVTQMLWNW